MILRTTLAALTALLATAPATAIAARDAYVADAPAGQVAQLAVGLDGALAPLVPPSLPAVLPRRLTMTPDGKSLYVTSGFPGHGRVLQFNVSTAGTASSKDPAAVDAGVLPVAVAMHPGGEVLYVADRWGSKVLSYAVGPGGHLESRTSLSLHGSPTGIAVAPDGLSAYVIAGQWVKRLTVGADGELRADSLVAVATGGKLTDVTLTPDGRYLYATSADSRVFQFQVGEQGLLSRMPSAALPVAERTKLGTIAVSPDGHSAYAAGRTYSDGPPSGRLFQFTIGQDGGLVAKDPPGLVLPRARLRDLALTPNGRTLYAAGEDLHLFDVDPSGLATPKAPPLFDMLGAVGVAVSPNQAPVASFEATVAPGGNVVSFDASGAADPDGSITRYDWDFGDGTPVTDAGPKPSHLYAQPGDYAVRLVVTDNEGASTRTIFTGTSTIENGAPSAATVRLIRIAAAAAPPAPAPPGPPAPGIQPPRPELGETIIVEPLEGRVRVRLPGEESFVRLETLRVIPVGSLIDARRGKTLLSSVRDRSGRVQQGRFFAGLFKVRQRRSERYVTELVLRGRFGPCPAREPTPAAAQRSRRRQLWGNANGRFRSQGRYSSSAVRGTRWLTQDSCEGTLTAVRRGRVAVRDFVRETTTLLEAGERYLARPG
jgi:6-phosphogluconolactonase (cycloisomerase 2 family)